MMEFKSQEKCVELMFKTYETFLDANFSFFLIMLSTLSIVSSVPSMSCVENACGAKLK